MEDYLVEEIEKNIQKNEEVRVKILMDAYRGQRLTKPGSMYVNSYEMVNRLKMRNINRDVEVGLYRANDDSWISNGMRMTELNEMLGVHHVKVMIFDNSVILTG